jgi:hypothetical protein
MTTLHNKSEILDLIKNTEFQALLEIESREDFLEKDSAYQGGLELYECYGNKYDEDEEGVGVKLFSTPKRGNNCGERYGTWLTVSKLYDSPELPFRVQAAEYVPWGVDIDLADIGDYRTLGEALDAAFLAHEKGDIQLNVIGLNEDLGRYVKGDSKISVPTADSQSREAQTVNVSIELIAHRQKQDANAKALRYQAPVNFDHLPNLLAKIKAQMKSERVDDTTNVRMHLAAAIKEHIFSGDGQLINVVNGYLSHYLVEFDGTTLVGVTRGKDTVLLDANGVYGSRDEANASITKEFTEIYKREIPERMRGFDEEPWEVYMDDNTFSPVIVAPTLEEADPDNPYRSGEEAVNQIVQDVIYNYKATRERRYQQSLSSELSI